MKASVGRSRLPFAIFYCKNRYTVTPTSKTPDKVNILIELLRKTLIFYIDILVFHSLSSLSHSWKLGLPRCLPDVSQMSPRCLPDVSEMSLKCLPDVSQISLRCLPYVSQMSPRFLLPDFSFMMILQVG